jgi:hypothetical protein
MPATSKHVASAVRMIQDAADAALQRQIEIAGREESMKMLKIVANFLRKRKRVLYGGFAINELLPDSDKFYDPAKELPDYDFMTPSAKHDVAELILMFKDEGYTDVEPSLGIHEGTYKVFVNYQAVADITQCDPFVYNILHREAVVKNGLYISPPNYLRMNMYLELSRPAGDVSRWEKVYVRLLLLNKAYPMDACSMVKQDQEIEISPTNKSKLYSAILHHCMEREEVLLGFSDVEWIYHHPAESGKVRKQSLSRLSDGFIQSIFLSEDPKESATELLKSLKSILPELHTLHHEELGELLPERYDIMYGEHIMVSVFQTVACHAFIEVPVSSSKTVRVGSLDTLLNFYFAFYYAGLRLSAPILCICQELVDLSANVRDPRKQESGWPFPLFPVECIGYQPTFQELKKAQRQRVKEERVEKLRAFKQSVRRLSARLRSVRRTSTLKRSSAKYSKVSKRHTITRKNRK